LGERDVTSKLLYSFAEALDFDETSRSAVLGGKGAALARMTAMGLPVPPGFTFTTAACNQVLEQGWFAELDNALAAGLAELETSTGRRLGVGPAPLLVSVRSGAPVSMPGMMDTVLNAGMTDDVAVALGAASGDEWFGWDTARRFVQSYVTVVLGASEDLVRRVSIDCLGHDEGRSLTAADLASATQRLRSVLGGLGFEIPVDPVTQIRAAIVAVFESWSSDRARVYREVEGISESLGTAATVQLMTFGNLGERSGTGVAFTRDPSTGMPGLVGDFLVGAQGEDVVAGTHATRPVAELRSLWPDVAEELDAAAALLEQDLTDLADIEFTVESGVLWMLQVRRGKRSPRAALRIAIDIAEDPGFPVSRAEALERVADVLADPPMQTSPGAPDEVDEEVLASGLPASPGRVVGGLCTDIDDAIARGARGESIILIRRETSPADIAGMAEARGLVTTLGGLVSHAAVVARSWGIPAVVGVAGLTVMPDGITVGGRSFGAGELLTVDGDRGLVLLGDHRADEVEVDEMRVLRRWQEEAGTAVPGKSRAESVWTEAATSDACERVLALKGVGSAESVAEVLGCSVAAVSPIVAELVASEFARELPADRLQLLPPALARVDQRFAADAVRLAPVIEPMLDDFHATNDRFKVVVTSWQMRDVDGETVPNDHSDPDYDASVLSRLHSEVHLSIVPILEVVARAEPRFIRYVERLENALAAIAEGDQQMVAHPMRESYHTVWFELHEELIRLTGRNRAEEAAAGRA
jgi:pyruvate,orthophosphate dikinase